MARAVRHVSTRFGEIAVEESGSGPPALFVHGIFLNGHLWRHVVPRVAHARRCVCVDLLAHGETRAAAGVEMRFTVQAEMLAALIDALGFDTIDLVANDSGGGIAQIFAAAHPARLRSLTLTNCDTHDNWPPPALAPLMGVAQAGGIPDLGRQMLGDPEFARASLAIGYEHPERVSDETLRTYLAPLFGTPERAAAFAA